MTTWRMAQLVLGLALVSIMVPPVAAQLVSLTDEQVDEAIALGKKGDVPIIAVGRDFGVSKGSFDVFIEGPIGRIATAAEQATKQLRPFTRDNVTAEMKEPLLRVILKHAEGGEYAVAQHVVLMPRKSKNLDDAIQPVRESPRLFSGAYFDRLPEGEFDVVVVTTKGTERYDVNSKARENIR